MASQSPSAPPRGGAHTARARKVKQASARNKQQQQRGRDSHHHSGGGGGLPLWPLSETSCQSAASSLLRISRIPAALLLPVLHARRRLRSGETCSLRRTPVSRRRCTTRQHPSPLRRHAAFLEKERPPACIEKPARKTACCASSWLDRSAKVRLPPPITHPGSSANRKVVRRRQDEFGQEKKNPPGRICSGGGPLVQIGFDLADKEAK